MCIEFKLKLFLTVNGRSSTFALQKRENGSVYKENQTENHTNSNLNFGCA
jgi:hypothetical protein